MTNGEKEKSLEEQIKELKQALTALIEIETAKAKLEVVKAQAQSAKEAEPVPNTLDKEALKEELKEVPLGELVIFAVKKDLIPRGTSSSPD